MHRLMAVIWFLAFAVLGASPLAGWAQAGDWPSVVAAARKEGRVQFYTGQTLPVANRIVAGFRKQYPDIAVEVTRGPSGEILAKVDQERAANLDGADVFVSTEVAWFTDRARENRLLRPAGPALKAWPAPYLAQGVVPIVGSDPFVIVYNRNLLPNPPKTYAELLGPEYRGKLGTMELASTVLVAWYEWLEKTQAPDFLTRLKAQQPRLYTAIAQSVASGEIAVSPFGIPSAITPLVQQGAPLAFVVPTPVMGNLYGAGALNWSRRPNAALVLVDYVMSAEGQTLWHGGGESASPLSGIPGAIAMSAITPFDPSRYPAAAVNKYREHWNRIFK